MAIAGVSITGHMIIYSIFNCSFIYPWHSASISASLGSLTGAARTIIVGEAKWKSGKLTLPGKIVNQNSIVLLGGL